MAKARKSAKKSASSITWTGKNLAEVKAQHKGAAQHPVDPKAEDYPRDWSQHPDNLHLEDQDGNTIVVQPGDTVDRDDEGRITVTKAPRTGRNIHASGIDRIRTGGGAS